MANFNQLFGNNQPLKILALGAHCDDIEIGCGGALLQLIADYNVAEIHWVVFSSNPVREIEAQKSAEKFLSDVPVKKVIVKCFRNGYFPFVGAEIKDYFEEIKNSFSPNLIFTHYREDRHQDHRCISDLSWNTFRDHLIFEYEIPKYDGDIGNPNFFIPLSEANKQQKTKNLIEYFPSQGDKQWFTENTFESIMRIRGVESNAPSGFAEAFYARKVVL